MHDFNRSLFLLVNRYIFQNVFKNNSSLCEEKMTWYEKSKAFVCKQITGIQAEAILPTPVAILNLYL